MTRWLLLLLTLMTTSVLAEGALLKLSIDRNEATLPVFVMRHPAPLATLILLPGADAGTGKSTTAAQHEYNLWLIHRPTNGAQS